MSKRGKKSLMRDERGLSTVEYTVLLVLVVTGAVTAWQTFGGNLITKINEQATTISTMEPTVAR